MATFHNYRFKYLLTNGCKGCGGKATHLHHILPQASFPNKINDSTNLLPLCSTCHNKVHGKKDVLSDNGYKDIHPTLNDWIKENKVASNGSTYIKIIGKPEHKYTTQIYFIWDKELIKEFKNIEPNTKIKLDTKKSGKYRNVKKITILQSFK